jgi:hypothetical protein
VRTRRSIQGRNRGPRWHVFKLAEEVGALRQSTEGRLSVVDEVLRAQARHCRVWRAGLAAAVLLLVVVASLWLVSGRPGAGDVPTGAVVGYIEPCEGAPVALYTSTGARVFSAAATVEALRGHEYLKSLGGGSYRFVFPVEVAARERVAQNQQFRFDRLSPGRYVIMAHYTGGNAMTWVDILVVARRTADVDLPNMCM